jgi:hypothetical protein
MNIHDLESFKLSDTVKFHDTLNPNLFTDGKMQDDVREQLLLIAEDFIDFMGIDSLEVSDIRLYGSNAAYTYTTQSDIDLHVLVDLTGVSDNEVYLELFNSKKQLYNDNLNITIHGMPVELYMQDASQPVKSLGDYSVSKDKWVKFPTKSKASFEETSVIEKFKRLVVLSELALRSDNIDLLDELIDTIRRYRKAGLEHGGEFSPENLAYKSLRNRGIVEKLYDYRDKLHSEYLSIDEEVIPQQNDAESRLMNELQQFMESSGYIPSEAERDDPRFSRALSVDVHPQTMKRQAKDMGLGNIARDGRPQRMNPSGKFTR